MARLPVKSDLHRDVFGVGRPLERRRSTSVALRASLRQTDNSHVSRVTHELLLTIRGSQFKSCAGTLTSLTARIARLFRAPLRICRGVLRATTVSIRVLPHLECAGPAEIRGAVHGQRRTCSTRRSTRSGFESDATKSRLPVNAFPSVLRAPSPGAEVSQ